MRHIEPINAAPRTENPMSTNRYRAPEHQAVEGDVRSVGKNPTKKSDIYSLSMIIVEVYELCGSKVYAGSDCPLPPACDRECATSRVHDASCLRRNLEGEATIKASSFRSYWNYSRGLEDRQKVLAPESGGTAGSQCRPSRSRNTLSGECMYSPHVRLFSMGGC